LGNRAEIPRARRRSRTLSGGKAKTPGGVAIAYAEDFYEFIHVGDGDITIGPLVFSPLFLNYDALDGGGGVNFYSTPPKSPFKDGLIWQFINDD